MFVDLKRLKSGYELWSAFGDDLSVVFVVDGEYSDNPYPQIHDQQIVVSKTNGR